MNHRDSQTLNCRSVSKNWLASSNGGRAIYGADRSTRPWTTPLSEEDVQGLKIESITTQGELNEAEATNIIRGQEWALRSRIASLHDMLSDDYLQRLHIRMFGDVWKWAGEFRQRDTNIGVSPQQIRTHLRQLYDEVRGWLDYNSYPPDEIAIRPQSFPLRSRF